MIWYNLFHSSRFEDGLHLFSLRITCSMWFSVDFRFLPLALPFEFIFRCLSLRVSIAAINLQKIFLQSFQNPAVRKPLFLPRNIRKFNRRNSTSSQGKLMIKSDENGDVPAPKTSTTTISTSATVTESTSTVSISSDKDVEMQEVTSTLASTTTTCTLTTSSSGVPPPLIIPKLQDPFWNKRQPERVGQSNSFGDCFVDDLQQVKFNLNSYKSVFLSKDYILYRSNSLKKAKQVRATTKIDARSQTYEFLLFLDASKGHEGNGHPLQQLCTEVEHEERHGSSTNLHQRLASRP